MGSVTVGNVQEHDRDSFTYDAAFAAMCIMEEVITNLNPTGDAAPRPWLGYLHANGINTFRDRVLYDLAGPCNDAWNRAHARYDAAKLDFPPVHDSFPGMPAEPGAFDAEFVPFWLAQCVDWTGKAPRVKGS